jgi:HK97 family phage major capsid protein
VVRFRPIESSIIMSTAELAAELRRKRDALRTVLESSLLEARSQGRQNMNARELAMSRDLEELEERADFATSEAQRGKIPDHLGRIGLPGRAPNTAGQLAPLYFDDAELRRLQTAAQRGESCRIETRSPGFSTADSLLPAQLFPYPVEAIHEPRLLDRLPGYAIDAPSITFIRHISTTGAAAPVAEGATKPEVVFNTDALTAAAVKLAANNGLSWEIINDWPAFQTYAGTELYRQIIDVEAQQLLSGSGTGGSMTGFFGTPGILTFDASTVTTTPGPWDAIELAIQELRTGAALAVADLLVLNPVTWSAIRRQTDLYGRYYAAPDPTTDQTGQAWGVDVLETTEAPVGTGLLLDTTKFGYVAVRESLSMRIGYSGTDFAQNILRTVAEERLVLCVTRPPAVLSITNLPTTETKTPAKASR